jgi:RHS repeat-associated protein
LINNNSKYSFGSVLWQNSGENERQSFIGKESRKVGISTALPKDNESSLGDFGVRKFDDFTGRFFQIDPQPHEWVWEKYYGWTPYQYSANNPVSFLDPGGEIVVAAAPAVGYGGAVVAVAIATWCVAEIQTPGSTAGFADAVAKAVDEAIADISGAMAGASITDATEQSIYQTTFASDATGIGSNVMLINPYTQLGQQINKQDGKGSKQPKPPNNKPSNEYAEYVLKSELARRGIDYSEKIGRNWHDYLDYFKKGINTPKEVMLEEVVNFVDQIAK